MPCTLQEVSGGGGARPYLGELDEVCFAENVETLFSKARSRQVWRNSPQQLRRGSFQSTKAVPILQVLTQCVCHGFVVLLDLTLRWPVLGFNPIQRHDSDSVRVRSRRLGLRRGLDCLGFGSPPLSRPQVESSGEYTDKHNPWYGGGRLVVELANVLERRITGCGKHGAYVDERRITWQISSADALDDSHEGQPECRHSSTPRAVKSDLSASFVQAGLRLGELRDRKHSNARRKITH